MSGFLWWVVGLAVAFVTVAIGDMVSDEIRGRLDRLPHAVLRLATLRLDPGDRENTYREVWGPDLDYYLKGDESRPITRLIRGMAFAVSLAWRVRPGDAPPPDPVVGRAALSDSGTLGGTSATVSRAFGAVHIAVHELTPREQEVLRRIVEGQSTAQMAREMNIATSTVRTYAKNLLSKLGVHSRLQAATLAKGEIE